MKEAEKNWLTNDMERYNLEELECKGYSAEVLDEIHVVFTTDEDIQKTTGGNYYYYFK